MVQAFLIPLDYGSGSVHPGGIYQETSQDRCSCECEETGSPISDMSDQLQWYLYFQCRRFQTWKTYILKEIICLDIHITSGYELHRA